MNVERTNQEDGISLSAVMRRTFLFLFGGAVVVCFLSFFSAFWFGIAYSSSGAILGMAILALLIVVQYPLMRVIAKRKNKT